MSWVFRFGAGPDPQEFYDTYRGNGRQPYNSKYVMIASAYGARTQRKWYIPEHVIQKMMEIISEYNDDANSERAMIEKVLGYMEEEFSKEFKMNDRKSLDWRGSGDSAQMDCIDEAWNATVLLQWINEFHYSLKHHTIRAPMGKQPLFKWMHWGACIKHNNNNRLWVIDGGIRRGGKPPVIYDGDDWYE